MNQIKERPILFSGPMVRAILDGRKTQTRRVVKVPSNYKMEKQHPNSVISFKGEPIKCPYGKPGDRLWVRETFCDWVNEMEVPTMYKADFPMHWSAENSCTDEEVTLIASDYKWRPSIHMARYQSRINLEITNVRVERLQDISEEDCWAEGMTPEFGEPGQRYSLTPKEKFWQLWESINGEGSWNQNPWVWAVSFNKVEL